MEIANWYFAKEIAKRNHCLKIANEFAKGSVWAKLAGRNSDGVGVLGHGSEFLGNGGRGCQRNVCEVSISEKIHPGTGIDGNS